IDVHPSVSLGLDATRTLDLGAVLYWRESTGDGVYDPGGNLKRASGGSDARYVGSQFAASLSWQVNRNLDATLASSYFVAGSFLEDTGDSENVAFLYLELRFRY